MSKLIDIINNHNKICWYPSAGGDFRELLFLSEAYLECKGNFMDKSELPDLFILTDCRPENTCFGYNSGNINIELINNAYWKLDYLFKSYDYRTQITLNDKVKLVDELDLPLDPDLFKFEKSPNHGKVFYMSVHVESKQLGNRDADVLYILAENTSFASDYLLKNNIAIDFIIKVRYGESFGGSAIAGDWMLKILKPLKVKYFLTNSLNLECYYQVLPFLEEKFPAYKALLLDQSKINLEQVHMVDQIRWSCQGDVCWYRVGFDI